MLFLDLYDIRVGSLRDALIYAKLGRRVFRENDITHSGAEMAVVLVLFRPTMAPFSFIDLLAIAFIIFPHSPLSKELCD